MESRLWLTKLLNGLFALALLLIVLPLFIPFTPKMPATGVDASWALGLNQALAQGLGFGRELIFTLGPYSSIYTKFYHPATDAMMLWGSSYLALTYYCALLLLMGYAAWPWRLLFAGFLLCLVYAKDALFFSYPLLLGLVLFHHLQKEEVKRRDFLCFSILFSPLGLLPLIKGSLLILSGVISGLCFCWLVYYRKYALGWVVLLSPLVCLLLFWQLAGQDLANLLPYVQSSLHLALAFSDAMSLQGNLNEVLCYLLLSGLILGLLLRAPLARVSLVFLFSLFAVFLFLSFKAGFTRHFGHAFIAGTSLLIAALLLPYCLRSKWLVPLVVLSFLGSFYIEGHYRQINLVKNIESTYSSAWYGLTRRVQERAWLRTNFKLTMDFLKIKQSLPLLPGRSDLYSYQQTELIASGNQWAPRPILQSYSVFNAALAAENARYLLSEQRPDNLFFKMQPIDNRWPALEEGCSWPIFLSHYQPSSWARDFLILTKLASSKPYILEPLTAEQHYLGQSVELPAASHPLFVEFEFEPRILGQLAAFFFKLTELQISVELKNGEQRQYRLIPGMARAPFLLSPFIENTQEFALLYQQEPLLADKQLLSFKIEASPAFAASMLWKQAYRVRFKQFRS